MVVDVEVVVKWPANLNDDDWSGGRGDDVEELGRQCCDSWRASENRAEIKEENRDGNRDLSGTRGSCRVRSQRSCPRFS